MPITGAGITSYLSCADGNVASNGTWAVASTLGFVDDFILSSNSYTVTTAYVTTATFTGNNDVVDGVMLYFLAPTNPTGSTTFSVALDQAGSTVTNSEVTVTVTNMNVPGPVFFKFGANITLASGTSYSIKVKASATSIFTLAYPTGTSSGTNFIKILRTTTQTGTPQNASGGNHDNIYILPEMATGGTATLRSITWNITATDTGFNSFLMGKGTLTCANSASTNYNFQIANRFRLLQGTINFGTSGTPLTSSTTMTVQFVGTYIPYIINNATFTFIATESKTPSTYLASNVASGSNSISVNAATGWAVSDKIAIASTSTSNSGSNQAELMTINSVSGTTIGLTANLANAHSGSTPCIAEVINLTRKNKFFQDNTTNPIQTGTSVTISMKSVEMYNVQFIMTGQSNTAGFQFDNCSVYNTVTFFSSSSLAATCNFTNNVMYNFVTSFNIGAVTYSGSSSFSNSVFMSCTNGGNAGFRIYIDNNVTLSNLNFSGSQYYHILLTVNSTSDLTLTNINIHHCGLIGLQIASNGNTNISSITISGLKTYATSTAISLNSFPAASNIFKMTDSSIVNSSSSIVTNTTGLKGNVFFDNCTFDCFYIFDIQTTAHIEAAFNNCTLIPSSAIILTPTRNLFNIFCYNCSTPAFVNYINALSPYSIGKIVNVNPSDKTGYVKVPGIVELLSNKIRYSRNSRNLMLTGDGAFQILIDNSETPTVTVELYKSQASDGAAFTGAQPQLVLLKNYPMGVTSDTVLATAVAANGTWETLTATLPAPTNKGIYYLDIQLPDSVGTTYLGFVEARNFTTTQSGKNPTSLTYQNDGMAIVQLGGSSGGGNSGLPIFINRRRPY